MNATDHSTVVHKYRWRKFTLREKLLLGSTFISTAILLAAAWVINQQVVAQARQQVQAEVIDVMPIYDAVFDENARSLQRLGLTIASSPVVKTILGDNRAAVDRATMHEMFVDAGGEMFSGVDLVLVSDGAGHITFAEAKGKDSIEIGELDAVREAAESKTQKQAFAIINAKLFQLVLTPVLVQSANAEDQNTLAVIGTGIELDRETAAQIKQRIHSEIVFLADNKLYASSLESNAEPALSNIISAPDVNRADASRPVEVKLNGELYLAFSRQLMDFKDQRIGQAVVLRSLANASRLFVSISNLLIVLWTISIIAAFILSYVIAGRITHPIESLVASVREIGRGNYEQKITASAHGELEELAAAFDQMRYSLKQTQAELLKSERLATVGRMASSIVHDLRNPLATMTTAADVLSRDTITPERRKTLIESQLRASQRMNEMLRELLEFSRGRYQLHPERLALSEIIERAKRGVGSHLANTNIVIESSIQSDLYVHADGERLRRVFENLFANSIQAMSQQSSGGKIQVKTSDPNSANDKSSEGYLRIDVIDSGSGVPKEVRERLFEPFVSYGKLGGTGLGLAIAKGVIEAHGGRIGLDTNVTQGADFYLELPMIAVSFEKVAKQGV